MSDMRERVAEMRGMTEPEIRAWMWRGIWAEVFKTLRCGVWCLAAYLAVLLLVRALSGDA